MFLGSLSSPGAPRVCQGMGGRARPCAEAWQSGTRQEDMAAAGQVRAREAHGGLHFVCQAWVCECKMENGAGLLCLRRAGLCPLDGEGGLGLACSPRLLELRETLGF